MAEETGRCVLTLPLLTEPWQEHIMEKRFSIVEHLKNQLIAMELRKLKNLQRTKAYRELAEKIEATPKEKRAPLYRERKKMLQDAGFSEYAFKHDMQSPENPMQQHFSMHITSKVAERAASDVWRAFQKYLYSNGNEVHFHKRGTLKSVACQANGSGMYYQDDTFAWHRGKTAKVKPAKDNPQGRKKRDKNKQLHIKVRPPQNAYEREMLKKEVKEIRVVRQWVKSRYKYYLQLTLVGPPVPKERKLGVGRVGIDIGTQTIAISSETSVQLRELAPGVNDNHEKKLRLQRQMDRSKRATNPENYNPDGTIRRPPKGERMRWNFSKRYKKLAGKVRELERKNAAIRKYEHTCLANEILSLGDEIYVEKMSFSGLQRRAKETKKDAKGCYLKKKRFGKSLANKAPATLMQILKTKAALTGQVAEEVNTTAFRASQFDHTSGQYRKPLLSERWKTLSGGERVQRDMYSAFLLMNSDSDKTQSDAELCSLTFENFRRLHDAEVTRIRNEHKRHLRSFGID